MEKSPPSGRRSNKDIAVELVSADKPNSDKAEPKDMEK